MIKRFILSETTGEIKAKKIDIQADGMLKRAPETEC
jgi:hypothetical protein